MRHPSVLPDILHAAYFSNMVVMPQCVCTVILENSNIHVANLVYQTTKQLGLIRTEYDGKPQKTGCYVNILNLEPVSDSKVRLKVEGVSRFTTNTLMTIKHYRHKCIHANYEPYFDDYNVAEMSVNFNDLSPIFAKHFIDFLTQMNMESDITAMDTISMNKFLNSLIMIMPMRDIERKFLSEIPDLKSKQEALSLLLYHYDNGLSNMDILH